MYKINIFATNLCNAKSLKPVSGAPGVCDFCFRPLEKIETSENIVREIVDNLDLINICEPITITGGEPLVSKYVYPLIELLVAHNHRVSLHTNGILLPQNKSLLPLIEFISLPYDGNRPELTDYYRGAGYFQILQSAFEIAYDYNLNIGLHTLTTPYNVPSLPDMGFSLQKQKYYRNIWYWYIKKFKKINSAVFVDTSQYELEETTYRTAVANMKIHFPNIQIIESGQINKEIKTIFIALNGDVFIYTKGKTQNELVGTLTRDRLDRIISEIK